VIGASSASVECEWCGIVPKCIVQPSTSYSLCRKALGVGGSKSNPGVARERAVNFKPGPRQNWNSKARSRSSTQRLSYALTASVLVGHDAGVFFSRGVGLKPAGPVCICECNVIQYIGVWSARTDIERAALLAAKPRASAAGQ
jgi:hypothetical protein